MNRKGYVRAIIVIWAFILWISMIFGFVFWHNFSADSVDQVGHTLQGSIDERIQVNQELRSNLQTPIATCDIPEKLIADLEKVKKASTPGIDNYQTTYADMLAIGMQAIPKNTQLDPIDFELALDGKTKKIGRLQFLPHLLIWYNCTIQNLIHQEKIPGTYDTYTRKYELVVKKDGDQIIRLNDVRKTDKLASISYNYENKIERGTIELELSKPAYTR